MKIRGVALNNRKAQLELTMRSGKVFPVPFARLDPRPTPKDRISRVYVDKELGNEAVTYVLQSGAEGSVHVEGSRPRARLHRPTKSAALRNARSTS